MAPNYLVDSQKLKKRPFLSFRRKSLDRLGTLSLSNGPESSLLFSDSLDSGFHRSDGFTSPSYGISSKRRNRAERSPL